MTTLRYTAITSPPEAGTSSLESPAELSIFFFKMWNWNSLHILLSCTFYILHTKMIKTFLLFITWWQSTTSTNLGLCLQKYVIAVWAFNYNHDQTKPFFLKNVWLTTSWLVCSPVPSTLFSPKAILSLVSVALLHWRHKNKDTRYPGTTLTSSSAFSAHIPLLWEICCSILKYKACSMD